MLQFAPQAASEPVRKVLQSAIANARVKADAASRPSTSVTWWSARRTSTRARRMKRFRPRAQGRAYRIRKRTSHITVVVATPATAADGTDQADKAVATKGRAR